MKCETVADRIPRITAGTSPDDERRACMEHIAGCETCAMAFKGATALWAVRSLSDETAPDGLFERVMKEAAQDDVGQSSGRRFWLGAGFSGAIAASLMAIAFVFGFLAVPDQPSVAEFRVSTTESRPMHVAIEADRPLEGATISILLSGDVRIDGFGDRRELVWTDDLDQGINPLT